VKQGKGGKACDDEDAKWGGLGSYTPGGGYKNAPKSNSIDIEEGLDDEKGGGEFRAYGATRGLRREGETSIV